MYSILNANALVFLPSHLVTYLSSKSSDSAFKTSPLSLPASPQDPLCPSPVGIWPAIPFLKHGGSYQPWNSKLRLSLNSEISGKVSLQILLQTRKVLSRPRVTVGHWLSILCLSQMSFQHHQWFDPLRENMVWKENQELENGWQRHLKTVGKGGL